MALRKTLRGEDTEAFLRILGFLMLVAGLLAAFGGRFMDLGGSEFEIGRYSVYRGDTGFVPVTVDLSSADAPLRAVYEVGISGAAFDAGGESTLTLVVNGERGTVATSVVRISSETAVVADGGILQVEALEIGEIDAGALVFVTGEGDRDDLGIVAADLILEGSAGGFPDEYQPIGFTLIAVGGVLLLLGGRRGRKAPSSPAPKSSTTSSIGYRKPEPEQRKPSVTWGRGGSDED